MKICSSLIAAIMLMSFSCENKYQHIIDNKDELIKLSLHQTISNNDGRTEYGLITYSSDNKLENQYAFEKEEIEGKIYYTLKYTDIQFSPDSVIGVDWDLEQDTAKVCRYYEKMSEIIKSYGIKILEGKRYPSSPYLELMIHPLGAWKLEYYSKGAPSDLSSYEKIADGWYLMDDGWR